MTSAYTNKNIRVEDNFFKICIGLPYIKDTFEKIQRMCGLYNIKDDIQKGFNPSETFHPNQTLHIFYPMQL